MMTKDMIRNLAAGNGGKGIALDDAECAELEAVAGLNPSVTEDDIAKMFALLRRRLSGQETDRMEISPALLAFFDAKAARDMDMLSVARAMGHDIRSGCEGCTCRC